MRTDGPVRTCAACRTRRPQGAFMRMARQADGTVCLDPGKKRLPGRGAYLCPDIACINLAERRQVLRRVLHAECPRSVFDELRCAVTQRCDDHAPSDGL